MRRGGDFTPQKKNGRVFGGACNVCGTGFGEGKMLVMNVWEGCVKHVLMYIMYINTIFVKY